MIPKALEKLILAGQASYRVHNYALGAYASIALPKDSVAIVTEIIWNNFIDQYYIKYDDMTWKEYLSWNEYALQIYSAKSNTVYQFRNRIEIINAQLINLGAKMAAADFDKVVLMPKEPVIIDTYLVHEQRINLRITRNAGFNSITSVMGSVTNTANEPRPPVGILGENTILQVRLQNAQPTFADYQPPNAANTGQATTPQYTPEYKHVIARAGFGSVYGSMLSPPDKAANNMPVVTPTATKPLVTIGYVTIHKNVAAQITTV
jgi:hypothetical protein